MVIVLFGVIASPNKDSLSNYNTRHSIRILTCLDDYTGQNSEFCIVSENFVSQNSDVLEKKLIADLKSATSNYPKSLAKVNARIFV